jgi:LysR family transcriptional regulator, hydrogen peroxide-inducible genes activator
MPADYRAGAWRSPLPRTSALGYVRRSQTGRDQGRPGAWGRPSNHGNAMELFQVRYFLALAKSLNFTRAAEACNVSQPALTRAIQRLEEELGGPLLYRERNLTQLTALGRALLPHLEAAHAAAETAAAQAAAFRRRDSTPLRLGIDGTLSVHILMPALRELQERIKRFEFWLIEAASSDLQERMIEGALDSAVMIASEKPVERLDRWPLFRERYVVLLPEDHRLKALEEIPIRELAEETMVLRAEPACELQLAVERLFAAAGVALKPRHKCSGEEQVRQMVAAGLGVALWAQHRPAGSGLATRPIADPTAGRDIVVAAVAGRPRSPGLAAFLQLMRARDWREMGAERV